MLWGQSGGFTAVGAEDAACGFVLTTEFPEHSEGDAGIADW
jgi:hypothetical protein